MFSRIMATTDLLETCDEVVLVAWEIARQNNARLYILHVLESRYPGHHREFVVDFRTGEDTRVTREYIKAVKEELAKRCKEALKGYENYEIEVRAGFPWTEILRYARQEKVDLIVMGPHAERAEGHIGSTVEAVIRRARSPVMIVNQFIPAERLKFKRIMVCLGFSKTCEYAFNFAAKLARRYQSKLFLFHMLSVPQGYYEQRELEHEIEEKREKIEKLCEEALKDITYECTVWEGTIPYVEILKYARERDVDLIVMGSHTKEKDNKWYVGSAVEQVSLRSPCPVMVVTYPEALVKFEG